MFPYASFGAWVQNNDNNERLSTAIIRDSHRFMVIPLEEHCSTFLAVSLAAVKLARSLRFAQYVSESRQLDLVGAVHQKSEKMDPET